MTEAQEQVAGGRSVVLDATYGSNRQRREVLRLARDADANVLFIECVARPEILIERLRRREKGSSVSDARVQHFHRIKERFEPLEDIGEDMRILIDTEEPLPQNLSRILGHDNYLLSR